MKFVLATFCFVVVVFAHGTHNACNGTTITTQQRQDVKSILETYNITLSIFLQLNNYEFLSHDDVLVAGASVCVSAEPIDAHDASVLAFILYTQAPASPAADDGSDSTVDSRVSYNSILSLDSDAYRQRQTKGSAVTGSELAGDESVSSDSSVVSERAWARYVAQMKDVERDIQSRDAQELHERHMESLNGKGDLKRDLDDQGVPREIETKPKAFKRRTITGKTQCLECEKNHKTLNYLMASQDCEFCRGKYCFIHHHLCSGATKKELKKVPNMQFEKIDKI